MGPQNQISDENDILAFCDRSQFEIHQNLLDYRFHLQHREFLANAVPQTW